MRGSAIWIRNCFKRKVARLTYRIIAIVRFMEKKVNKILKQQYWSPYVVGALLGVLSWITFGLMNKALGVSTSFVRAAGTLESGIAAEHVQNTQYFAKYLAGKPAFEWQMAMVIALFFGALLSAKLSGTRKTCSIPSMWQERFGDSRLKRNIAAFLGGALLLFGARLAGGCTSGHAISGGLQLAVSGWIFMAGMFAAGIPAAMLIYRKVKNQ